MLISNLILLVSLNVEGKIKDMAKEIGEEVVTQSFSKLFEFLLDKVTETQDGTENSQWWWTEGKGLKRNMINNF